MDGPERYYHAIITVAEHCDGCMNCLRSCPTHALRIRNKTPTIRDDRCIDCGACIMSCPRKAIVPDVDRVRKTNTFQYRVAVPSPVLYAQFGLETSLKEIHLGLMKLGFRYISDVFAACTMQSMALQEHLSRLDGASKKPLISAMCPVVVRLIQVKYPTLVSHVLPFELPRELSAKEAKIKVANKHGTEFSEVGAFYISPCPAKNISVLQPAEKERSFLDGVISISDIYLPLRKAIAALEPEEIEAFPEDKCVFGSGWERAGFLSRTANLNRWIGVTGLQHVMRILDDIEEGKLDSVDFVEANTCIEGCVGGALCVENIYVARSKTLMLEREHPSARQPDPDWVRHLYDSGYFFMERELKPRSRRPGAPSIPDAILLMKERDELARKLPGLDCCACGSPSCVTFAEDVVLGAAELVSCPYLDDGLKSGGP